MNGIGQISVQLEIIENIFTYLVDQFLSRGTYRLIIMTPFHTNLSVIPFNSPNGIDFEPDQDTTPHMWNSILRIQSDGHYTFQIMLDRLINGSQIFVQFIFLESEAMNAYPTIPPWPPIGDIQLIWNDLYYQDIIRRLYHIWIMQKDRDLKTSNGLQWYVDPYGRKIGPGGISDYPPKGFGSPDPVAYCWHNNSDFALWIRSQPRP